MAQLASIRRALPEFAVVICAYTERRWDDLVAAVAGVEAQTHAPAEIVVVVDHCPALLERAKAAFRSALVIANTETKGLSGARNAGVNATSSEIVAFVDDDAVADPRWLESLASAYVDPFVFCVGGTVRARWADGRPPWFPREFDWVVGCSYRGQPRTVSVVRNVIGCNMSFRREVLDEIGGFRSELGRVDAIPTGCEETEMCIRASQRYPHGKIVLEPDALVHHHVPADRATAEYFRSRCLAEGRSKAILSTVVGDSAALASERSYATRVLPTGVLMGLFDVRATGGPSRAKAIIQGFTYVAAGYVQGRWTAKRMAKSHV